GLGREIRHLFPDEKVNYPGIGIFTREVGGRLFVSGVMAGLPGDRAGLKVGDEILGADGKPFQPVASFEGKTGQTVAMRIRRSAGAPALELGVVPQRIEPNQAFLQAMADSTRIITVGGARIGYI